MITRAIQAKLKSSDAYDLAGATEGLSQTDARTLLERVPMGNPPGTANWPRAACFDVYPDEVLVARYSPSVERDSSQRKSFVTDVVCASYSAMENVRWNPFALLQAPNRSVFEEFQELAQLEVEVASQEKERDQRKSLRSATDDARLTEVLAAALQESSSLWLDEGDLEGELELAFLLIPVALRRFLTFNTRLYVRSERLPRIAVTDPDRMAVADLDWGFTGRRGDSRINPQAVDDAAKLVALLSDEDLLSDAQQLFDSVPADKAGWNFSEGISGFFALVELLSCLRGGDIPSAISILAELDAPLAAAASARFMSLEPTQIGKVVTESREPDVVKGMKRLVSFMIRDSKLEANWYRRFIDVLRSHERRQEIEADYRSHLFLGALVVGDRKGFLAMFEPSLIQKISDDSLKDHALRQGPDELGSLLETACTATVESSLDSVKALLQKAAVLGDDDPPIARATVRQLTRACFDRVNVGQGAGVLSDIIEAWGLIDEIYLESATPPDLVVYARKLLRDSDAEPPTSLMAVAARDELRSAAEALGWAGWVLVSAVEQRAESESLTEAVLDIVENVYPDESSGFISALAEYDPRVLKLPGWSRLQTNLATDQKSHLANLALLDNIASVVGDADPARAFSGIIEACLTGIDEGAQFTEGDEFLPKVIGTLAQPAGRTDVSGGGSGLIWTASRLEVCSYLLTMLCADDAAVARLWDCIAEQWQDEGVSSSSYTALAELQSVDRARSVIENLRNGQGLRQRVLETAADPELQDGELAARIKHFLPPNVFEWVRTRLLSDSADG